jgi:hypothetical protein
MSNVDTTGANFIASKLYKQVLQQVGGNKERADEWWRTPLPQFNFRTPQELLNEREWIIIRDLLENGFLSLNYDQGAYIPTYDREGNPINFAKYDYFDISSKGRPELVVNPDSNGTRSLALDSAKIYTFTSSGVFVVDHAGVIEYVLVGGGGGGGGNSGGGGGGGGAVVTGTKRLEAGWYDVIIGNGGSGSNATTIAPTNGQNTSAFGIIAPGGGAGATVLTSLRDGLPIIGSSGGGGSRENLTGASGTLGFGFGGGNGNSANQLGGGGGGAGGPGGNADVNARQGGAGGAGVVVSITGVDVTYGGGGGGGAGATDTLGGAGGTGGGASARNYNIDSNGNNGSANRGGGGSGGSTSSRSGGNGGSGIVIIKFY